MSVDLITHLRGAAAFDPTPLPADLAALHVPFDELLGSQGTEAALEVAAESAGRIALVGAMGSGKSSVLSYVLAHERGFAALPISVAPEDDATVTDPGRFAQHVVRVVSTWAAEVELLTPDSRDALLRSASDKHVLPSRSSQTRGGIALQLPWLVKADVARDIRRDIEAADELDRSAAEHLQALRRLSEMIRTVDLTAVLVIDDSDRWLQRGDPRTDIVEAFFGRVIRELAELEVGFAVAVHDSYLELDGFRDTTAGILNDRIDIPQLSEPQNLEAILDHRIIAFEGDGTVRDILHPDALERLWRFHIEEADGSVRKTLQILHTAVTDAAREELAQVTPSLIEAATAAWPPPRDSG